jgi:hypothetical protein
MHQSVHHLVADAPRNDEAVLERLYGLAEMLSSLASAVPVPTVSNRAVFRMVETFALSINDDPVSTTAGTTA